MLVYLKSPKEQAPGCVKTRHPDLKYLVSLKKPAFLLRLYIVM